MKAGGHMPFEEFPLKEVDQLVHELDKVKPAGSTVIVTPMEDSHHSPCLKEMIAVMVHTAGKDDQSSEIHSLYQYWPECKIAVRVLSSTDRKSSAPSLPHDYWITPPYPKQPLLAVRANPQRH